MPNNLHLQSNHAIAPVESSVPASAGTQVREKMSFVLKIFSTLTYHYFFFNVKLINSTKMFYSRVTPRDKLRGILVRFL